MNQLIFGTCDKCHQISFQIENETTKVSVCPHCRETQGTQVVREFGIDQITIMTPDEIWEFVDQNDSLVNEVQKEEQA